MTTIAADEEGSELSIDDYKSLWVDCEEKKMEPRLVLKSIAKEQRAATKALRSYMEENLLTSLDCGQGWHITCEETEKITFSEDICSPYMEPVELARLKREQTKRKSSFKILPPPKKPRTTDALETSS